MKKLIAILAVVLIFTAFGPVFAQEVTPMPTPTPTVAAEAPPETEDPGILPDSPFYVLKTFWENVQDFLTRDPFKKAELHLQFAQRRLAETQKMCEKGKCGIAEKWLERFQVKIQKATWAAQKAQEKGRDVTALVEKLQANLERQQAVLDRVIEKAPEPARGALLKAKEASSKGINQAIESITKEKPVKEGEEEGGETETEEEEGKGRPEKKIEPGKGKGVKK